MMEPDVDEDLPHLRAALQRTATPTAVFGALGLILAALVEATTLYFALGASNSDLVVSGAVITVFVLGYSAPCVLLLRAGMLGHNVRTVFDSLAQARAMMWFWHLALVYSLGLFALCLLYVTVLVFTLIGGF